MAKSKYKLSDKAPFQQVEKKDPKTGIITVEEVQGLYPFGPQCQLITNDNLTDGMAEYLLEKEKASEKNELEVVKFKSYIVTNK